MRLARALPGTPSLSAPTLNSPERLPPTCPAPKVLPWASQVPGFLCWCSLRGTAAAACRNHQVGCEHPENRMVLSLLVPSIGSTTERTAQCIHAE